MRFESSVAIVTGGGGSIGRAVALKLGSKGAAVVVADINAEQAGRVAEELRAKGVEAKAVETDLRDATSIRGLVDATIEAFGKIDILVNTAGGSARGKYALFHEQTDEVLEWVLDVNLLGPMLVTRAVVPHMIEKGRGKIVLTGSIVGQRGLRRLTDYAAAKGGVIAFTKSLAMELGEHSINVNCVSPGIVPRDGAGSERAAANSYLGRACTPENVADLVAFLCSEEASYITGQNYVIDGGRSLGLKGE